MAKEMKPYLPETLPVTYLNYSHLAGSVGIANAELARYDGLLQAVVNPEILLSSLTTQEAVLSSKIEGTQATVDKVLKYEAGISIKEKSKLQDIQEIINYRSALILAEKELKERPLTLFLIRQMHTELMTSVRGFDKNPGQLRTRQNWIGKLGATIEKAIFVPPEPHIIQDHLQVLEAYIQKDDKDILIQCAIIHAQFELIHPFLDGNGRIGRLLIPLFLFQKKRLFRPMFYMSEYLEIHRDKYYSSLRDISKNENWNDWIEFFLQAITEQAKQNSQKVKKIIKLHKSMVELIFDITHSRYTVQILDSFFNKPIFRASDIMIPKQTIMPILKQLKGGGILITLREASGRMPAVYAFKELLKITEGKNIKL